MRRRLLILAILLTMILYTGVYPGIKNISAQNSTGSLLTAIGGGYRQVQEIFLKPVFARTTSSTVKILVLPIAYATDPLSISADERSRNLVDAEKRREQIFQECKRTAPQGTTCQVELVPVFTRSDADKIPVSLFFPEDLNGVFILGGDQTIAMQVSADTLLEEALQAAYERGVVIGGTSAGTGVLAYTMLGGYKEGFSESEAFKFGAVDLWGTSTRRGLSFGVKSAILDQHFYQLGRFGRLLNAVTMVEGPHVGLGVDADAGAQISANIVRAVGNTSVAVLDAETYHAASSAQYLGANRILSMRNALVHLLPPGNFEYNLETREHSLISPMARVDRSFSVLSLPNGAGRLFIGGGLKDHLPGNQALNAFANASGGENARILIIATGYTTRGAAQREAERYSAALRATTTQTIVLMPNNQPLDEIPTWTTGILILGKDASVIQAEQLGAVAEAWRSGLPVFADHAGASIVGEYYSSMGATPKGEDPGQPYTQATFIQGGAQIRPGLGLLKISVEPELLTNNRWGRLFSLAYEHPRNIAIGLTAGTTIVISEEAAQVWGENGVMILDLSTASLSHGTNRAYAVANGLIDVFGPGELLRAEAADQSFTPSRAATPVAGPNVAPASPPAQPVPTLDVILPATIAPTQAAISTPTRLVVFPNEDEETAIPTDERLLRSMIFLGAATVLVILAAIWINRRRVNPR